MESFALAAAFLFALFALLGAGVWVGLALMGAAYIGMALFTDRRPATRRRRRFGVGFELVFDRAAAFHLDGRDFASHAARARIVSRSRAVVGGLPGRLLHTNIVGCAVFAAISDRRRRRSRRSGKFRFRNSKNAAIPKISFSARWPARRLWA